MKLTKSFRLFHIANQERTISLLLECIINVKDISTGDATYRRGTKLQYTHYTSEVKAETDDLLQFRDRHIWNG